jgi:hypothetical protein
LLLDGWDEIDPSMQSQWRQEIQRLRNHVVGIISCRRMHYKGEFGKPYYLFGLQKEEQRAFLQQLAREWSKSYHERLLQEDFARADDHWANEVA